jgi:hypothetical protein
MSRASPFPLSGEFVKAMVGAWGGSGGSKQLRRGRKHFKATQPINVYAIELPFGYSTRFGFYFCKQPSKFFFAIHLQQTFNSLKVPLRLCTSE